MEDLYLVMEKTNYTKEEVLKKLESTEKIIKYTYGLGFRNPTIHKVPVSNEKAARIFDENSSMCDVHEHDEWIHLNEFSSNDLL